MTAKLFTDEEVQQLLLARLAGAGVDVPVERDELMAFVRWAEEVRSDNTLLSLVLDGKLTATWAEDDWVFKLPDATPDPEARR